MPYRPSSLEPSSDLGRDALVQTVWEAAMSDGLATLMRYQMEAEFALAHGRWPDWITSREPTKPGSYYCSMRNKDMNRYTAVHYWDKGWRSISGVWETVEGWMECPKHICAVQSKAETKE